METKNITEYNPQALKKIYHFEFSKNPIRPVYAELDFENHYDLICMVQSLLFAIESIGISDDKENMITIGNLAIICRKLLPLNEMEFLDNLLIKREGTENQFVKI